MTTLKQLEVWFVTGSQNLYGPEVLKQVAAHSQEIARALDGAGAVPVRVVFKPWSRARQKPPRCAWRRTPRKIASG